MKKGNPAALLPIGVFLVLYLGLGLIFEYALHISMGFYQIPIVVIFLVALVVAFLQNKKLSFDEKIHVIAQGLADDNIITMCLIFLLAGIFSGTIGAAGGVVAWAAFVLLLTLCRRTIHNEDELRQTLNFECLTQIPDVKISSRQPCPLILNENSNGGFEESVRLLRLRVEKTMEEQGKKVLLVSSAIPGEGKTTISVNLAASLAQTGKRVLLIDCDLRKPACHILLEQQKFHSGIKEVLRGTASLSESLPS